MSENKIPYKIYLSESEIPSKWYNLRADMKNKPAPLLNPGTGKPMTAEELSVVFCEELVQQELDDTTAYIDIPQEIQDFYKMYRPAPLVRAYCLEKALGTPAKIYYKFEGNNTSGSHKVNSAIAQAYYAKKQGLKGVTTETGAGQWGTALSMACAYLGLDCKVYMVKVSYEQKPFRREVMRTYGAEVTPSPSNTTNVGRKILAEHPGTTGSLGCAISEAVEVATSNPGYRYVLGSVLNQVLLHQSVIGLEAKAALDKYNVTPDIIIGCAGGGSNLGGLIAPFMGEKLRGEKDYRIIAVEPASCPSFTRGKFAYDFCRSRRCTPSVRALFRRLTTQAVCASTVCQQPSASFITTAIWRLLPLSRPLYLRLPSSSRELREFSLLPKARTQSALPSTRHLSARRQVRKRQSSSVLQAQATLIWSLTRSSTTA